MVAWLVFMLTVLLGAAVVIVLGRQGSPGRLCEEDSPRRRWHSSVVGRPAGPDAEAMAVGQPGQPSVAPFARPRRSEPQSS